jgi:hypothetical protein
MLRIKKEEEDMKRRMELRKATIAKQRNATIAVASPWVRIVIRPFRSQTVKVVVLSISVATMAWMYNYMRPGLEVF